MTIRVTNALHRRLQDASDKTGDDIAVIVRKSLRRFKRLNNGCVFVEDIKKEKLSTANSTVLNIEIPDELLTDPASIRHIVSLRLDQEKFGNQPEIRIHQDDRKYMKLAEVAG